MKEYNDRVEKALDFLCVKQSVRSDEGEAKFETMEGKMTRDQVIARLRQILEIDKQCSQCLNWNFDFEMSLMEGTDQLICQDCAENIISGEQELIEEV